MCQHLPTELNRKNPYKPNKYSEVYIPYIYKIKLQKWIYK